MTTRGVQQFYIKVTRKSSKAIKSDAKQVQPNYEAKKIL